MRRFFAVTALLALVMLTGMTNGAFAEGTRIEKNTKTIALPSLEYQSLIYSRLGGLDITNGGAVNNYEGTITSIDGILFKENEAKYGGAIYNFELATIRSIVDTKFEKNSATYDGGAIYHLGFLDLIMNSTFTSNAANGVRHSSKDTGYGGAIYQGFRKNDLTIVNTNFTGNNAARKGGAIAFMKGDNLNIIADATKVEGDTGVSVFSKNLQAGQDNDIYMGGSKQNLNLTAYGINDRVELASGIDFNKDLIINVNNGILKYNTNRGLGTVAFTGDIGSSSKRADMNLYGGIFSLSDKANANIVYAGKVYLMEDTRLAVDVILNAYDDVVSASYDIFNFSSFGGNKKLVITADDFYINGELESGQVVTAPILLSSSSFRKYVEFRTNGKKVGVLYKFDDQQAPIYKIRMNPEGKFIISNPYYIDLASNPLAYAVNFNKFTKEDYESSDVAPYYTLAVNKNITIDSWEELPNPDDITVLEERNIQQPETLIITGKNKTITAIDKLDGIIVNDESKTLDISKVSFIGFSNAIINKGGNIKLTRVGFTDNINDTDDGTGAALSNLNGTMSITGTRSSNKAVFYNNTGAKKGGAIYNSGDLTITYGTFGKNATKKANFGNKATKNTTTNIDGKDYVTEYAKGGAIFNSQYDIDRGDDTVCNLTVTNSTFVDNRAHFGGAIYNEYKGTVNEVEYVYDPEQQIYVPKTKFTQGDITEASVTVGGNFRRNKATTRDDGTPTGEGGAIYNTGYLTASSATFGRSGSTAEANTAVNGGAVANEGGGHYVSNLSSYYSNNATGTKNAAGVITEYGKGGAIYNKASGNDDLESLVEIQSGTFTSNQADYGGAIYNDEKSRLVLDIDSITSKETTFSSNVSRSGMGGAIYNLGIIAPDEDRIEHNLLPITGILKNNKATLNAKTIDHVRPISIPPDSPINQVPDGLYKMAMIAKATAYSLESESGESSRTYFSPRGGAIYNKGQLELSHGNIATNSSNAAVTIGMDTYSPSGTSTAGTAKITMNAGKGGAIYSDSELPLYIITSTLSSNSAAEKGGAVYNANEDATLYMVNGVYKSNKANSTITTQLNTTLINGVPKKSKITIKESVGTGGAIYSEGAVDINNTDTNVNKYGKFVNEEAFQGATTFTSNSAVAGGAIYTDKTADIAYTTFNKNSAKYTCSCSNKTLKELLTDTALASGSGSGGAVYAKDDVSVASSVFTSNSATQNGGGIYTKGNIEINANDYTTGGFDPYDPLLPQTVSFSSNSAKNGGAIYADGTVFIKDATFTSNKASGGMGGAIYTESGIEIVNTDFNKNSAAKGGALYVAPGQRAVLVNTSFTNNTASEAGGAIYASENSTVYIIAYNKDINITGNKAAGKANSIFMEEGSTVYLDARVSEPRPGQDPIRYTITFSDGILGNEGDTNTNVYLRGGGNFVVPRDKDGKISIIKNIHYHDDVSTGDPTDVSPRKLIESDKYIEDITNSGSGAAANTPATLSCAPTFTIGDENQVANTSFTLSGARTTNIANNIVGTLSLNTLELVDDTVSNFMIDADLKNGTTDKIQAKTVEGTGTLNVSSINLTSNSKSPVVLKVGEDSVVSSVSATSAETAEATYKLKTSMRNGMLTTVAYGQKAKPCTVAAPVAAQLGGYLTQINSYDQAFMNMDISMTKTLAERKAEVANRYAYTGNEYTFTPENGINRNGKGLWTRPYVTFERVNLHHGPKVSSIGYGNFFGGDADVKQLRNGWTRQFSAYVGYNGSTQDYERQSIDQNGGTIGVTEVWYKNNFFTGLTANVGANAVNASTDLGHENFPMLMAGVASKTGYNFEFKGGKFIIQPSLLLSYSFVHTFSHSNGKGSHVGSSPLNAIQVAPGLKFIFNLPKGWQPYLGINMRWNIMDKTHFSLPDVSIPEMSVDPYVEYGIGVQRKWGERFTGFGQAMIRNGGRNGVMLSFGFKWALGK